MNWEQVISDEEYAKKLQQQLTDEEYANKLQSEFNSSPQHPQRIPLENYSDVIQKVMRMPSDRTAINLAGKYGFNINTVSWEDTARTKGSVWGPCISDMTLKVENSDLPVIRSPNFEDLTWDVAIEKIPLVVGNEHGENLRTINLKQYLEYFPNYLHSPYKWKSPQVSLLAPRDSHVIMSSQACFLPIPKDGGEAKFNVAIFNYQSSKNNPAVLAIVANERGTSAQIVENIGGGIGQKLYFNDNGQKCPFIGQRLSEYRIEQGQSDITKPMSESEKQKNMLLIIQIPLKHRSYPAFYPEVDTFAALSVPAMEKSSAFSRYKKKESADVEDAVIKVGTAEGVFTEIGDGVKIERDPDFPIRVTLQFYKATSNGVCDETHMAAISEQIKESRKFGVAIGSLVVGDFNTGRVTEHVQQQYVGLWPLWWSDFWLTYKDVYPQYNLETAANLVFKGGRFRNCTLNECKQNVLDVLGSSSLKDNQIPTWKIL